MEVPAPPLAGGAVAAAPGRLGGPHPGPRAGGRGRLLLFGCGSPRRSHDTARPGPCRRLGRRRRAARYGTRSPRAALWVCREARRPSNGTRSPRAALSGRSRGGRSEAGGSRRGDAPASAPSGRPHPGAPIRAPVPTGVLGGGHRRSAIADQDRVGVGGPPGSTRMRGGWVRRLGRGQLGGASRLNAGAGGSVDAAACGTVATPVPFAPSGSTRARAVRWRSDPATQKGGRRGSFTLRPALLPSRSGAMTPFLMSVGAAAHLKDTRRPPFSAPPTPRAATAGPPEASTAPGPSSTPARTATAGVASRSPRGNHRTAPGPARISRIRPARHRP